MIHEEQFKSLLPKQYKGTVTQEVMDSINNALADPIAMEAFKENIISYTSVMKDGRFKIGDYVNAVKYVSLKILGHSNVSAYFKTFPDRHQEFINRGTSDKDVSSYVSAYNKNKLVNLVLAQTIIPHHVLNNHMYQEALNVQFNLMNDENVSPKVRTDAANSLLTHLKPPETTKIELDIGVKEDGFISSLKEQMVELAATQARHIQMGISSANDIAKSNLIIDGEFTNGD